MPTTPRYRVQVQAPAARSIRKLPRAAQESIGQRIATLAIDPRPHGCVKLKETDGLYRVRTGNYRIIYSIQDDVLLVCILKVGDRKVIYGDI